MNWSISHDFDCSLLRSRGALQQCNTRSSIKCYGYRIPGVFWMETVRYVVVSK